MSTSFSTFAKERNEAETSKRGKRFSHIVARKGHRGHGFSLEIHHTDGKGMPMEAKHMHYGKGEGGKVLADFGRMMGIPGSDEEAGETEHNEEQE